MVSPAGIGMDPEKIKSISAKAWIGVLVGYSIDTPGYRIWDPTTHRVWDVRSPDFDEIITGGWWRKPVAIDKPAWGGDEPLHFDYVEDPPVDPLVEQPGAIVPVPPAAPPLWSPEQRINNSLLLACSQNHP